MCFLLIADWWCFFVSAQIGTSASFASACRLSRLPPVPSLQLILICLQSWERGDGIHGLGLWSCSPISRLSQTIDFCWNQKLFHLQLELNIPIAEWPKDGRVPENPSQVPQSPESDFQKTANVWRAPNGQTISTSGMLIFCLFSCRFYRRCYLCRGTAKRKVLCCERILGRQHEKVDVNDVREKR